MIKYKFQHVDYYENNPVRAFEFKVSDGKQTALLGNREDIALRDETNQFNIIGELEKRQIQAAKNFKVNTDDPKQFEEQLQSFLQAARFYGNRTEIETPLAEYIKDYNEHDNKSLTDIEYNDCCVQMFNNMDRLPTFSEIEKALGKQPQKLSFIERMKKRFAEPAEPSNWETYYLPKFSKKQKEDLGNLFDLIKAVPEKKRKNVINSFHVSKDLWRMLDRGDAKEKSNYMKAHPQEEVVKETNQKITDIYNRKRHKRDVLWDKTKTEEEKKKARLEINELDREILRLSADFSAKVVIEHNPDVNKELLQNLITSRIFMEEDTREQVQKDNRAYSERRAKGIQYEDLKKVFLTEAIVDQIRFEQYKKTGDVRFLAAAEEIEAVGAMDKAILIKTYGPTMMSSYKSAAFIMEALKKDKKEGKNIVPIVSSLTKMMDQKYQFETEFNPDGIKQFMFDTFVEMEGESLNKFSKNREVYTDFIKKLKGHNGKRLKAIDKLVSYAMTDKIDVTAKKKAIKTRLTKRAEELKAGKSLVSGTHITTEVEKEIKKRAEEGYEVKDRNKVIKHKKEELENKKELTPHQKKLVEKFTEMSK